MEKQNNKLITVFKVIIYIYFFAGIIWHLLPQTRTMVINITPYGLTFFSIMILFLNKDKNDFKTFLWIASIFIATIIIEIIGVNSALIFGNYSYSNVLGLKLLGVPIVIGLNWTIVIIGLFSLTEDLQLTNILIVCLIIGSLAVLFDIVLEPVAVKLDYWQWESNIIPIKNYLSWFGIAFLFGFVGFKLKLRFRSDIIKHYIIAQFIFLSMLNLFL